MDTIIKALESRGVKVAVESEREGKPFTCAHIDGEKVILSLEEGLKIVKIEQPKYSFMDKEFVPTGVLSLCIKNYFLSGCQTKWSDGKQDKIEQKITPFLNGLFFSAVYLKKQTQEREAEKQRWAAERKEEARKLLLIEEEKKRGQVLEQQAQSWQKSRQLRSFVRAVAKKKGNDPGLTGWVNWATAYADRIDPLVAK